LDQVLTGMIGGVPQGKDRVYTKPATQGREPPGKGVSFREDLKNTITNAENGRNPSLVMMPFYLTGIQNYQVHFGVDTPRDAAIVC
jgi:hypothetical protein